MTDEVVVYRRRLPHWRLTGSVYFVTWRLAPSQTELTPEERVVTMSALRHFDGNRYELYASVVMHDHVHVLFNPWRTIPYRISFILGNLSLPLNFGENSGEKLLSGKMSILTELSGMSRNFWKRHSTSSITHRKFALRQKTTLGCGLSRNDARGAGLL